MDLQVDKNKILENLLSISKDEQKATIVLNTDINRDEKEQLRINLKNFVDEAKEKLGKNKNFEIIEKTYLKEISSLEELDGCLVFHVSENTLVQYSLPYSEKNNIYIGNSFYLVPLISYVTNVDTEYYVLSISDNNNRLLKCTKSTFEKVEPIVEYWPKSLGELQRFKDRAKQSQYHSNKGGSDSSHHGHNKAQDLEQDDMYHYFRMLDDAIGEQLDRIIPVFIAATEVNAAMYKEQTKHTKPYEQILKGDFDDNSDEELCKDSLVLLKELEDKRLTELVQTIPEEKGGSKLLTNDLDEIIKASFEARIDNVILKMNDFIYGKYSVEDGVNLTVESKSIDTNLTNTIAINTFINNGKVMLYSSDSEEATDKVLALLRY